MIEEIRKLAEQADKLGLYHVADKLELAMLKLAFPKDLTKSEKKYLREAEDAVAESYDESSPKYWATVTEVWKAKVEKHLGYDPFKKRKDKKKKKEKSKKK